MSFSSKSHNELEKNTNFFFFVSLDIQIECKWVFFLSRRHKERLTNERCVELVVVSSISVITDDCLLNPQFVRHHKKKHKISWYFSIFFFYVVVCIVIVTREYFCSGNARNSNYSAFFIVYYYVGSPRCTIVATAAEFFVIFVTYLVRTDNYVHYTISRNGSVIRPKMWARIV